MASSFRCLCVCVRVCVRVRVCVFVKVSCWCIWLHSACTHSLHGIDSAEPVPILLNPMSHDYTRALPVDSCGQITALTSQRSI